VLSYSAVNTSAAARTSSTAIASNTARSSRARRSARRSAASYSLPLAMACSKMVGFDVSPRSPSAMRPASSPSRTMSRRR
jgi:hypothetical protein